MPLSICRVACRLAGALFLTLSAAASAATFTEIGDASNLFDDGAGPQDTGVGIDTIVGAITPGDAGDLFKVTFATGELTITATRTGGVLDPQIYLFDALGQGIASNDNADATTTDAVLVLPVLAGTYYLGIGHALTVAIDRTPGTPKTWSGTPLPPLDWGTLGSIESDIPRESLSMNFMRIEFAYKTPEPGTLVLMLMALAGALALRRSAPRA
jgi:hypothetical protein